MTKPTLIEIAAKAIWAVRPDCAGKPWPLETAEQRRAYPHNPIAAVDLCFEYAKAALCDEVLSAVYKEGYDKGYSAGETTEINFPRGKDMVGR